MENRINELTEKYCMAMAVLEMENDRLQKEYDKDADFIIYEKNQYETEITKNAITFLKERLKHLQETLTPSQLTATKLEGEK